MLASNYEIEKTLLTDRCILIEAKYSEGRRHIGPLRRKILFADFGEQSKVQIYLYEASNTNTTYCRQSDKPFIEPKNIADSLFCSKTTNIVSDSHRYSAANDDDDDDHDEESRMNE